MLGISPRSINALVLAGFALSLLSGNSLARTVNLAWDAPSSYKSGGYKVYYGQNRGQYTANIDVGNQTSHSVAGLQDGITYCFAVTAYDAKRSSESGYSNEVCVDSAGNAVVSAPSPSSGGTTPASAQAPSSSLLCDSIPTLDSIATPQSVRVGQVLKLFATAVDCDGDKVIIRVTGKPRHAKFTQGYNAGFQKQLGKLKFKPSRAQANKSFELVFTAREVQGNAKRRQISQPKVVTITVLPAVTGQQAAAANPTTAPITRISITSAQYHPKQKAIVVIGRLHTESGASKAERKNAFYGRELTLIDSESNSAMGSSTADDTGKFKLLSAVNDKSKAACFIEVETSGFRGKPRAVKGLLHCM